ncbi:hypothetical protein [Paracoccus jeotgali]|uniref:hypothetical protein n=1 Tax=Paracoccus jeotgali TaxID=2065379 RepID=UPI0013158C4D|nr:hypothetical protein [Paracoccus jeotgali]
MWEALVLWKSGTAARWVALRAAMLALVLALPAAVAAQQGEAIPPPRLHGISQDDAEKLMAVLAQINVVTSNCPDYRVSDAEWMLLITTGDMLARRLGIDADSYERDYYGPAFRALDDPGACDRIGPTARPLIDDLIALSAADSAS